jgi:hypothetical protein
MYRCAQIVARPEPLDVDEENREKATNLLIYKKSKGTRSFFPNDRV